MALWAIIIKDNEHDIGFDLCDPIEAEDAATALDRARAEKPIGETWPELEAVPLETRNATRPSFDFSDHASGLAVSKHAAGQQRKPKPRKPGRRWSWLLRPTPVDQLAIALPGHPPCPFKMRVIDSASTIRFCAGIDAEQDA